MTDNPILNSPYHQPKLHYNTNLEGELDYEDRVKGRRIFVPFIGGIPKKQGSQKEMFSFEELTQEYKNHIVNILRTEIQAWRVENYPNTTGVTRDLLQFWFENPERVAIKKLFFAQQEAIETAIWLNEVAHKSDVGNHILSQLKKSQQKVSTESYQQLPRIAFKMATGTGKTVVMAALILYHFLNRQTYRQDTRFADYFLAITPGITIKDRLGVLYVDISTSKKTERNDYYSVRDLVPLKFQSQLPQLNQKLVITNYHSFEPRNLQGNKKSPLDGKIIGKDENGKEIRQIAKEGINHIIKRILGDFKVGKRLLVLNDEAHHCYLPKSKTKTKDTEGDENAKAAIWFTGITELGKKFKLTSVYDLSATPYYLQGSGYTPYTLFDWVVSDFGLTEAIESGLVKIPYLPQSDDSQELTVPVLANLYEHVKGDLSKMGERAKKRKAKEKGEKHKEEATNLPSLLKTALDKFYSHYKEYADNLRTKKEEKVNLFSRPPVFIAVCNNTAISKEVYKFLAGYELIQTDKDGNETAEITQGRYDLFSNYDEIGRLKKKAPTILIDSEALDNAGQINDDFKKSFSKEIEEFKREYAQLYGDETAKRLTDGDILREVVNTVGQAGKLGAHIRCVVSVSMLTEGWDANTVTHIMGLRAFGSQLLCEQVAGRALRRMNYYLQDYDKDGNPTTDKRKSVIQKFPPEYAHIIGVPFQLFKKGTGATVVEVPDYTQIKALKERKNYEITFPNIDGYRIDYQGDDITFDFSEIENFELDGSKNPTQTTMQTAVSDRIETLEIKDILERRTQSIIYSLTKKLIEFHFSDEEKKPDFKKFNDLKEVVKYWYENKIKLIHYTNPEHKKLIDYQNEKTVVDHIRKGINRHHNTIQHIKPIFNVNREGSTSHVHGLTTKEVFETTKSHINYVVMDSGWEAIAAKAFEELEEIETYAKNNFLYFSIPYIQDGQEKRYYPDFIARVKTKNGKKFNLIIEITGFNKDKVEKRHFVENRWLPAINSVVEKYNELPWHFVEIADDIRNVKNELLDTFEKINAL